MRVGLVIENFDPRRGGAEQWTCQFAAELVRSGHEVHVIARSFPTPLPVAVVPHVCGRMEGRLGFAAAAEQTLRRLALDVVHDMGYGWHSDVFQPHSGSRRATVEGTLRSLPRWIRPLKRRFSAMFAHHRDFERLRARQVADDGKLIIALSKMVARDLAHYDGVDPARIRLIYNGVDSCRFSPAQRAADRERVRDVLGVGNGTLLLFIAAHNFRLKGIPNLLRAVGLLASRGFDLHLAVAGGKRLARWARRAAASGAARNVTFLGPLEDVRPLYAAADVYVQPTFYDPCSLVVLEAWASGLPVITTRANGASELMTEGVEGLIVDNPADVQALAEAVVELVDPAIRERMGTAARRLALAHSLERNCAEILAVYEEIAPRRLKAAA